MSLLAKILRIVPKSERDGICIKSDTVWEVAGIKDKKLADFFRALPSLLPQDSILYLESTYSKRIVDFLMANAAKETRKVAIGTIWPRPNFFHIVISESNMTELARLSERCATPEVCIHVHAYKNANVLLEWYDAFAQPLWLSPEISKAKVAEFCGHLECHFEKKNVKNL